MFVHQAVSFRTSCAVLWAAGCLVCSLATGQSLTFTAQVPPAPFLQQTFEFNQYQGPITKVDIDQDQDIDLFFIGGSSCGTKALYLNDGMGNFNAITTPFNSSMYNLKLADVDGDGDFDVLVFNAVNAQNFSVQLYRNLGSGTFQRDSNRFKPVVGMAGFGDMDGDGDQDLVITGDTSFSPGPMEQPVTFLYKNDGTGYYSPVTPPRYQWGNRDGFIRFYDFDQDSDQDLFFFGKGPSALASEIFTNDGTGRFTPKYGLGLFDSVITHQDQQLLIKDLDGDGTVEFITPGRKEQKRGIIISRYHQPSGTFIEPLSDIVEGTLLGSPAIYDKVYALDWDFDGDFDLLARSGFHFGGDLFINDGNNSFSQDSISLFRTLALDDFVYEDFNGDGHGDFVFNKGLRYFSDTSGKKDFAEVVSPYFQGINTGTILLEDLNGDSLADFIFNGNTLNGESGQSQFHLNQGGGLFDPAPHDTLHAFSGGALAANDIDQDGDIDLFLTGDADKSVFQTGALVWYENDGNGRFTTHKDSNMVGLMESVLAFTDFDEDGDPDLFSMGRQSTGLGLAQFYENDGQGHFKPAGRRGLRPLSNGDALFFDADGDGDEDVLLTGDSLRFNTPLTLLYRKDAPEQYSLWSRELTGLSESDAIVLDADDDGDLDLALAGRLPGGMEAFYLYRNDSSEGFREDTLTAWQGMADGVLLTDDWDGNGLADIMAIGTARNVAYRQGPAGTFTAANLQGPVRGLISAAGGSADLDQDGRPDLILAGLDQSACRTFTEYFINSTAHFSLAEQAVNPQVELYPNPSDGTLHLKLARKPKNLRFQVYNLQGQKLSEKQIANPEATNLIHLHLPKGLYLLRVAVDEKKWETMRIILK